MECKEYSTGEYIQVVSEIISVRIFKNFAILHAEKYSLVLLRQ